jgi:DNA replication protein DnaD
MMFGFDERFAMFDITPVENQFVLEYLPAAKGDFVKVYLYGLMCCYHPEKDMNLDMMCHELNMAEEDVLSAFRYWERRRLVRRISDNPPAWQYVNIKQLNLNAQDNDSDPEYEEFSNAVYEAFDKVRRLHGSEINACFEWHEDLGLPTEVIIMLLNHMVEIKGKNFRFTDAEKTAVRLAEEKIRTIESAEEYFLRNGKVYKGVREVLKKLGKNYTPSEAQLNLYLKWIRDWHFTHDAILEALELTAKGDPSMGYLDGILNSIRLEATDTKELTPEQIRNSTQRADGLKEVLKELGKGEVSQRNLMLYDQMLSLYPKEIILTAARECGHNGKDTEEILKLLQSWKEKGLDSRTDVEDYVKAFHDQTALIRELRKIWGTNENRIGKTDRSLVSKWESEFGFSKEAILAAAPFASEAKMPMAYLDRILTDDHQKGITDPETIRKEHGKAKTAVKAGGKTKTVSAQEYDQRDYTDVQQKLMDEQRKRFEERLRRNGGKSDA